MRLITSERAKRDIEDIARYIALDSPQSAEEFHRAFNNTCELLLHTPEMGTHDEPWKVEDRGEKPAIAA
jgi:plasmid stabilization system protein ParE